MEGIASIDFSVLNTLQDTIRCGFLDVVLAFFGTIGNAGLCWIVVAIILLFFRKTRAAAVMMLAAMALGFLIGDIIIKPIVARPRPFLVNTDINLFIKAPSGYSFPSGHSCAGFASATVLLLTHRKLGFAALGLASVIAFSRLYCYVHYPSDVLCGIVLGILSALLVVVLFRKTTIDRKILNIGYKIK